MPKFSAQQFEKFREITQAEWIVSHAPVLHETFRQHYTAHHVTPDQLVPVIRAMTEWARGYGIESAADLTRLSIAGASFGHRFWDDPRTQPMLATALADTIPVSRRAMALTHAFKNWLRALWQGDDLKGFSERLTQSIGAKEEAEPDTLRHILPGHWNVLSDVDNRRLIHWLNACLPPEVPDCASHRLTYAACALVHGTGWLSDPQYPRLAALVLTDTEPADLVNGLTALYTEALS